MTGRLLIPLLLVTVIVVACAAPGGLPSGPTPIPTLAPATLPTGPLDETPTPSFAILSYPARLPSSRLGEPIYEARCAQCHGSGGEGTVAGARNFNDLDYMRGEMPASFYAAVTEGRGQMPSFRETLTSDERWDVVFYVWRFSTSADALVLGQQIFEENCAACHGPDGTGAVLGASDFTDLRLVDDLAPRDLYLTVTQGRGSMPAWQGRLSQDERWAVIDYIRTFSYEPALPGAGASAPTPTEVVSDTGCDPIYLAQSNPFEWDDGTAIAAGESAYGEACAVCHGPGGAGALPGAPDLRTAAWQSALRSNPGEYLCVVSEGRQVMPGWKETLSREQIWQVLTFLGSLGS